MNILKLYNSIDTSTNFLDEFYCDITKIRNECEKAIKRKKIEMCYSILSTYNKDTIIDKIIDELIKQPDFLIFNLISLLIARDMYEKKDYFIGYYSSSSEEYEEEYEADFYNFLNNYSSNFNELNDFFNYKIDNYIEDDHIFSYISDYFRLPLIRNDNIELFSIYETVENVDDYSSTNSYCIEKCYIEKYYKNATLKYIDEIELKADRILKAIKETDDYINWKERSENS